MRMLRWIAVVGLPMVLGCATGGLHETRQAPDPRWALCYVRDDSTLCFDPPDSAGSRPVFEAPGRVILPRCSPDAKRVAFYTFDDRLGKLIVLEIGRDTLLADTREPATLAEIDAPVGERTAIFPPIWDGESLLVVDASGIHRIGMDRSHELITTTEGIVGVSISADAQRIAYSNGAELSIRDLTDGNIKKVRTTSASQWQKRDFQPIAFSPDGGRIAYGAGNRLFLLDVGSRTSDEIAITEDPIFWIQWLQAGSKLILVTGKTIRNIRLSTETKPYATARGRYALWTIEDSGGHLELLFEDWQTDAHLAQPSISPDGRHVALVAADDGTPTVVIVATDSGLLTRLTPSTRSDQATWFPMPAPRETHGCQAVVFYPLD